MIGQGRLRDDREEKSTDVSITHTSASIRGCGRIVPLHSVVVDDEKLIVTEYERSGFFVLNPKNHEVLCNITTEAMISSLGVVSAQYVIVGHINRLPEVYDVLTQTKCVIPEEKHAPHSNYTVLPKGSLISDEADSIRWWSEVGAAPIVLRKPTGTGKIYSPMQFNQSIISLSASGTLQIWDIEQGSLVREVIMDFRKIYARNLIAAVLPNGHVLVGLKFEKQFKLINPVEDTYITLTSASGITSFAVSSDKKSFVVGDCNGNIQFWDIQSAKLLASQKVYFSVLELLNPTSLGIVYVTPFGSEMGTVQLQPAKQLTHAASASLAVEPMSTAQLTHAASASLTVEPISTAQSQPVVVSSGFSCAIL